MNLKRVLISPAGFFFYLYIDLKKDNLFIYKHSNDGHAIFIYKFAYVLIPVKISKYL